MPDTALLLYVTCAIVSGYGLALFVSWWAKVGKASAVYKYITFLFLGIFLNNSINTYARLSTLSGHVEYLYSWWWEVRGLLILVCVSLIVGHMTYRLISKGEMPGSYREVK